MSNYNDFLLDALRAGVTPEELAAALEAAQVQIKEEEAKAEAAAKTAARNDALKDIIESTLTWFDDYAPDADVRSMIDPNIDYNELAEMMIELAASLKQLAVLTHVMPTNVVATKKKTPITTTKKTASDDDVINLFLKSLGI